MTKGAVCNPCLGTELLLGEMPAVDASKLALDDAAVLSKNTLDAPSTSRPAISIDSYFFTLSMYFNDGRSGCREIQSTFSHVTWTTWTLSIFAAEDEDVKGAANKPMLADVAVGAHQHQALTEPPPSHLSSWCHCHSPFLMSKLEQSVLASCHGSWFYLVLSHHSEVQRTVAPSPAQLQCKPLPLPTQHNCLDRTCGCARCTRNLRIPYHCSLLQY